MPLNIVYLIRIKLGLELKFPSPATSSKVLAVTRRQQYLPNYTKRVPQSSWFVLLHSLEEAIATS